MATPKDVQDLLRMLTSGRNKMPMMAAMGRIKDLQAAGVRSIKDIATVDLAALSKALEDEKVAKQLKTAAKKDLNSDSKKRGAADGLPYPDTKRTKSAYDITDGPQTQEAQESSLSLPEPSQDEEEMLRTSIYCNRAPLVLAFAVALLKYTMPEQPLSSRLSLAQAVVSLNSQSKAASLGLASVTAEREGWGQGQPKVRVMGREVPVLKRGGYEWKEQEHRGSTEEEGRPRLEAEDKKTVMDTSGHVVNAIAPGEPWYTPESSVQWAVSESVTSQESKFIARCVTVTSPVHARRLAKELIDNNPELRDATHNVTAFRVQDENGGIIEDCEDDGESGGGRHVLQILQSANLVGVMLVMTRWYGGIMLGKQRWVLMTGVCRDALSQRLRVSGTVSKQALWGLDLEVMRTANAPVAGGIAAGMPIHKPEAARAYILKAFASGESGDGSSAMKKKTGVALERDKARNLGLLLGALDLLFSSWSRHVSRDDLDRRAWIWYTEVRPDVDSGVSGWGAKGSVKLAKILSLRRKG